MSEPMADLPSFSQTTSIYEGDFEDDGAEILVESDQPAEMSASIFDSEASGNTSHTPHYEPLTSFSLFPKLPPELRVMIWRFALPGPRVVEPGEGARLRNYFSLHSSTIVPPPVLQVNREAREVGLEKYELVPILNLLQPWPRRRGQFQDSNFPQIYFNFREDILYISEASFRIHDMLGLAHLHRYRMENQTRGAANSRLQNWEFLDTWNRVQNLAIDSHAILGNAHHRFCPYSSIVETFPSLKNLTIVRDWTTWNLPSWELWWFEQRLPSGDLWGLSHQERCFHEMHVLRWLEIQADQNRLPQNLPRLQEGFSTPKMSLIAYLGDSELIEAYGDALLEGAEGPLRPPILIGPEMDFPAPHASNALHFLGLQEENYRFRLTVRGLEYRLYQETRGRWPGPLLH